MRATAQPVISPSSTRPSPSVAPVYGPAGRSRPSLYSGHVAGASRVKVVHLNDIAFVGSSLVAELPASGVEASLLDPPKPGSGVARPWKRATVPLRLFALVATDLAPLAPMPGTGAAASVALRLLADEWARLPAGRDLRVWVVANHDVGVVVQRLLSICRLILGRKGRPG